MKKYLVGVFAWLSLIAFGSMYPCLAQATYDFFGTIQIKVGKKEINEEVYGTVVATMREEVFMKKEDTSLSYVASGYDDTAFKTTFNFEFGSELTKCGDPLAEESLEVKTFPQGNNVGGENLNQVRLEFDQNAMTAVIGRILKKYGDTVRDALGLEDCFSLTGIESDQSIAFLVNHISGMAYVKDTSIKISFSGNSLILVSDSRHENQKRHLQKVSGKLNIPFE
jgi:hypothetical protein